MLPQLLRIVLVVLFGSACAGRTVPQEVAEVFLPPEEEAQLSERIDAEIHRQLPVIEDDRAIARYVERVGQRVGQASTAERGPLELHFEVIDDPNEVNAFTSAGGNVYVYTGLLRVIDDEAELAAVLAHEVAHVAHRDVARLLLAQYGLETITEVAFGQNPGALKQIATGLAAQGIIASHTREQERNADRAGLRYLAASGYEPSAMLRVFEKLERLRKGRPGAVESFFATHPSPEDRFTAMREEIARLGRPGGERGADRYAAFRSRLVEYYAARGRRFE